MQTRQLRPTSLTRLFAGLWSAGCHGNLPTLAGIHAAPIYRCRDSLALVRESSLVLLVVWSSPAYQWLVHQKTTDAHNRYATGSTMSGGTGSSSTLSGVTGQGSSSTSHRSVTIEDERTFHRAFNELCNKRRQPQPQLLLSKFLRHHTHITRLASALDESNSLDPIKSPSSMLWSKAYEAVDVSLPNLLNVQTPDRA